MDGRVGKQWDSFYTRTGIAYLVSRYNLYEGPATHFAAFNTLPEVKKTCFKPGETSVFPEGGGSGRGPWGHI